MDRQLDRYGYRARRVVAAALLLALAACGGGGGGGGSDGGTGGGGGGGATEPPPGGYALSGTISIAPTAAVDSDLNDVNQSGRAPNNLFGEAQPLVSPVLLVGTVNRPGTGPAGRNFDDGDEADLFLLDLVAGQTVELEFAEEPSAGDLDLYLADVSGSQLGASNVEGSRFECVSVTQDGRYYVSVEAFRGASIYSLRIGAPGSAAPCANRVLPLGAFVEGEVLATPAAPAREKASALERAAGLQPLAALPATGLQRLRLPADAAGRRAGLAALRTADPRRAASAAKSAPAAAAAAVPSGDGPELGTADALRAALSTLRYAKAMQASGAWRHAQPNWIARSLALVGTYPPDDRLYSYQRWHYEMINLPSAMDRIAALPAQPTRRPLVAVVDTGVVLDHPDLAPQLFSTGRSFLGDGSAYTDSGDDTAPQGSNSGFHGTHVAGTIAASTFDGNGGAGVAPMAQILPVRVLGDDGSGSTFDILQGLLYAARLPNGSGVLPARAADVVNLSLGSDRGCTGGEQDVFDQLRAAGVIVVAAAGNSARNDLAQRADVGWPANCNHVIAVSALDGLKALTYYSNSGAAIDVAAPGGDMGQSTTGSGAPDGVYSALATFDASGARTASFGPLQGTSMASPHVAGVMALMRYVNPALTPAAVDTLIAQGVITDDIGGTPLDFGRGLIDARKAVDAALDATGGGAAPPPPGVVIASPSSLDLGSLQTSLEFDLQSTADTPERVVAVGADTPALRVGVVHVDSAGLGTYSLEVDRSALAGDGPFFQTVTVTLSPSRSFTIPVTIRKPATGPQSAASYGPLYVQLLDPDTRGVLRTVLAQPSGGRYDWGTSGLAVSRVAVIAGGDLDNDGVVCQRGEPCGGYPVLSSGGELPVIELTGNRDDLDFSVAPLSAISAHELAGAGAATRRSGGDKVVGGADPSWLTARKVAR